MKKLILLAALFLSFNSFSQDVDIVNRVVFNQMKKMDTNDEAVQEMLLVKLDEMRAETKDSVLIKKIDVFKLELQNGTPKATKTISTINQSVLDNIDTKKFKIVEDKFQNLKFIYNKKRSSPRVYIAVSENYAVLRLSESYSGSDWIFMDTMFFLLNDEERMSLPLDNVERDVISGSMVKEYADVVLNSDQIEFLSKIEESTRVDIKTVGKGTKRYELTKKSKININDILKLYQELTIK